MIKQIVNKLRRNKKFTALVLGATATAALPPFYHFYVLFLTLSGLFLLVENSEKSIKAFACGYWFGFGFFSIGFYWVGNALLVDAQNFGWLYPIALIGAGTFFGFFIAFPTYIAHKFKSTYIKFFVLCSMIVIFEWLRSFVLTGFPWNLFGTTLAFDTRLLQLASIFGTYGLSLMVLLVCTAPGLFINERNSKSLIVAFAVMLFIIASAYHFGNDHIRKNIIHLDTKYKIRMVQPNISQKFKWDEQSLEENLQEYIDMSRYPGLEDIDIVIWGETASPFPLDMDHYHLYQTLQAIPEDGYLVTGSIRYEFNNEEKYFQPANSLFVINKEGAIVEYYDKSHLVPFGEYIPLKEHLPTWVKPITKVVGNFKIGEGHKKIKIEDYPSFGPLICYEIIFPSKVINKENKPEWIINVTNDGWYGNSSGPHQHLVAAQLRAIEEGLTIARVANTGISALISYTGEIIDSIPLNKSDILDVYLPKKMSIETTYGKYGNFIILILLFTNILMIFISIKRKK